MKPFLILDLRLLISHLLPSRNRVWIRRIKNVASWIVNLRSEISDLRSQIVMG